MKTLALVLFILPLTGVAQSRFYVQGVVGQYSMKEMKQFQQELNEDIISSGVNTKVVTDFPASLQIEAGGDRIIENADDTRHSFGGYINYALTKGRLHYGDYSGETYGDQDVSRILLGFRAAAHFPNGFELYGKVGFNYSMLELDFVTTVYDVGSDSEKLEFYSTGISVEPGVSWNYVYKDFSFSVQTGYEINKQGKTIFKKNEEAYLLNKDDEKVTINWSGIRLGLGVAYRFGF